jgi:RNA polymerase sigma-32 factor
MTEKTLNHRATELVTVDTLDRYVSEINRYKLLSREDEHSLALRFAKEQDLDAAHELVTANLRFVVKVAHEYKGYGLRLLDLIQEGNIGLMMAVKKFEPKRGFRLISYAVWWIRAYMQNFVLKSWSLVKIGTTQAQRKLFYKLRSTQAQIAKLDGRQFEDAPHADPAAVAKALNVDVSEVIEMDQRLSARDFSLDQEIGDDSKLSFVDRLTDDGQLQDETAARNQSDYRLKERVATALKTLNEKERYIVEKRLMADEPLTLREIGERFRISRERARQIEANVIKKVKKLLTGAFEEAYA